MYSGNPNSTFEIDYQPLQLALANQEWREADRQTTRCMVRVLNLQMGLEANRVNASRYTPEQLRVFPCIDLNTIDRLWMHYSQGRYGFSAQRQVWLNLASLPDANEHLNKLGHDPIGWLGWCMDIVLDATGQDTQAHDRVQWDRFVEQVGWRRQGEMVSFDDFFASPSPRGSLPLMFPAMLSTEEWLSLITRVGHCTEG